MRGLTSFDSSRKAAFLFCSSLLALILVYREPNTLRGGPLDTSWKYGLEYAYLNGLSFGKDLIFTSGPLSFIYTGLVTNKTYLLFAGGLLISWAAMVLALASASERWISAVLLFSLVVAFAPLSADAALYLTPFFAFLYLLAPGRSTLVGAVLVCSLSLLALSKFTTFAISILFLTIVDILRIVDKERPIYLIAFLLVTYVLYVAIGQDPTAFGQYLFNSFEVANGYGKAMGNFPWSWRLTIYVSVSLLLVIVFLVSSWILVKREEWRLNVVRVIGFALLLFFVFKGTAVRVGHDSPGWPVIGVGGSLIAIHLRYRTAWRFMRYVLAAAAIVLAFPASMRFPSDQFSFAAARSMRVSALEAQLANVGALLHPQETWKDFITRRAAMDATLAASAPQGLKGTVGAVPWDFAEVIAAGYDFVPQFSLQQYSSYTHNIRREDADHFAGSGRPQNLLFNLKSIDHRYPPQDLGPSLLELIRNYDFVDRQRGWNLLASRVTPRRIETEQLPEFSAKLGEWVDIPAANGHLVTISIQVHRTLLGRLLALLYKEPHLTMSIRQGDGRTSQYRYVPTLGEDGFLLLPPNTGERQLFERSQPTSSDPKSTIVSLRLDEEGMANYAFSRALKVRYSLTSVHDAALRN